MAMLRNELKFYLNPADACFLQRRLMHVLDRDSHTTDGLSYSVHSLYFDDPVLSAFHDKIDGLEKRAKYRIRYYFLRAHT